MRRFNFDEYLKNPSKRLVTRDGEKVRIICTNAECSEPIIALVRSGSFERVISYSKKGIGPTYQTDLFFDTEKSKGWVEVYESLEGKRFPGKTIYATKEEAEKNAHSSRVAIAKIEWEE